MEKDKWKKGERGLFPLFVCIEANTFSKQNERKIGRGKKAEVIRKVG
jgi:hypothetical protein